MSSPLVSRVLNKPKVSYNTVDRLSKGLPKEYHYRDEERAARYGTETEPKEAVSSQQEDKSQ